MAGAGYKLFNTGDVLTAAQVNTYLQEQVVMVFNDATARTTALSGVLAEGMVSYLKSTKVVEIYNGTAWASLDDPNAIQNTIVDAKADLITATANDTPARLAVGSNNQTIVADSATATGLKYANGSIATLTAKGDLLAASAANTPARLAVGANDLLVTADSSTSTGLAYTGGWTTWTPTYQNMTIGNGSANAKYQKIGKTVNFYFDFLLGSTSTISTSPNITLPITAATANQLFNLNCLDSGVSNYFMVAQLDGATGKLYFKDVRSSGTHPEVPGNMTATTPFTWGTDDRMTVSGTYEVA